MATVTSLGFSIYSRYDGDGLRRARRDIRNTADRMAMLDRQQANIARTAAALSPALVGTFGAAVKASSQAATAFVSAGIGLGIYGLAVRNVIKRNAAAQAQISRLKAAFNSFGTGSAKIITQTLTIAVDGLIATMKALEPAVKPVARVMRQIALEFRSFAQGPHMKAFGQWVAKAAPEAIWKFWTATKNLGVALFVLGKRLGFFEQSTFLDWLVRVTARFREWANSPGVTKLAGWLNQNSEATGRLVAALFRLSMALLKAMAPLSGPMINALATFANILAWIAERAPWVVQGILLMMTAHRIYAVAVSLVNGLMAVAIGIHKAYRAALVVGAAASRIAAAATLFLRATLLRTVGATIAHGAAMTVASARMVASRVAALASAAAHAVLSGALFRSVGAAIAAGAAQLALGVRLVASRTAMLVSAAASAVLSGSLFRTVGAAIAAGAAQLVLGARMVAARAAMLATAATSAVLSGALFRTVAATIAAGAAAAVSGARMAIMRGVTLAWAAAQWVLNAALMANPYVLIALAIIALVAAIVLAYKRSETFRNIVQAAFRAVAAAGSWMWNTVLKPAFQGIATAAGWVWGAIKTAFGFIGTIFRGVGAAAMWLWRNAISPVFRAIGTLAGWLWQVIKFNFAVMVVLFRTVGVAVQWLWSNAVSPLFRAIGRLAVWLWNNAIGPAFRGIGRVVVWLGNTIFRPIFNAVIAPVMRALGRVAMWLWNNAIGPAFRAIGRVAMWLWNNAIKPAFTFIRNIFRALGQAANYLMNSNVNAFQLIARAASWLWARIRGTFALIGGVFVKVANGLVSAWNWAWSRVRAILSFAWGHIRSTFGTIRGWIGSAWDWVANKIRGAWNWAWTAVRNIMSFAWARIRGTFNTIRGWVGSAWDWVANKLRGAWNWAWSQIRNIMSFAWARIRGTFNTIRGWVGSAWDWVANKLRGAWNWAWSNIRNIMSFAWSRIRSTFNTIRGWIGSAWDWVANKLRNAWNWAWNRVRDILNFAWSRIRGTFNTIRGWISSLWSRLTSWMARVWDWAWRRFREILNFGWSKIRGTFNVIKGWLSGAWSWIANKSVDAWNWLWNRVRDIFNWTWGKLRGSINAMKRWIHSAFDQIVRGAGRIWEGLKSFVGRPINFVIGFVADRLIPFANKALSLVLGKKAPQINAGALRGFKIPGVATGGVVGRTGIERGYAAGGVLPGYTPGRDIHIAQSPMGPIGLSGGEGILRPEVMRVPGMTDFLHAANAVARHGGISGVKAMMKKSASLTAHRRSSISDYPAEGTYFNKGGVVGGVRTVANFDDGGIFGTLKRVAAVVSPAVGLGGSAAKWTKEKIETSGFNILVDKILGPIYNRLLAWIKAYGPVGSLIGGVAEKVVGSLVNWVVDKTSPSDGGDWTVTGKGLQAAIKFAKSQHGKPYQWGGGGNPSWDCSGFMAGIQKVMLGQTPGRLYTTFDFGGARAPKGWKQNLNSPFMVGVTNRGKGHMAGTLVGTAVESSSSGGVRYGRGARGHDHPMFEWRYGFQPATKMAKQGGGGASGTGKGLASYSGTGAAGGALGVGRPAFFTHFWDGHALTASGSPMTADTIASSYIPLGSHLTVGIKNKSTKGVIRDLGPAKFVYDRHPGIAVLDLATPMMKKLTGRTGNAYGKFRIDKVGKGRTLYGRRLRGYAGGGTMSPGELALVGERGPEVYQAGGRKGGQIYTAGTSVTSHGDTHVHIHGNVYTKSEREFRKMVVTAIDEARRKKQV